MKITLATTLAVLASVALTGAADIDEKKETRPPASPSSPVPTPPPTPPRTPIQSPTPKPPATPNDPAPVPTPEPPAAERAPANDADFVTMAGKTGHGEVKLSELGASKAHSDKVRELALMLVKDHTAANKELQAVAGKINVAFPETPDAKVEERFRELSKKTGEEFDVAFLKEMAASHGKTIERYEAGKKIAKHPDVKAFIDRTLPVIKKHAAHIKELGKPE